MDAAAGFGGVKESGFGREGGREGMYEYLRRKETRHADKGKRDQGRKTKDQGETVLLEAIDRTPKLFIGGKQARSDSGYSRAVYSSRGRLLGQVGDGNRKDIRNGWGKATAHNRAQILYFIGENLSARAAEFAARVAAQTGKDGRLEVENSIEALFTFAAWADKFDGAVHSIPMRGVALAMNEPIGVLGIVAPDESPLLGMVSLLAPAIALGNTVVLVPSQTHPLSATDFYSVLETSDVPAGVVNIVTGDSSSLGKTLAEHMDVDGLWFGGNATVLEKASAANLKRTWHYNLPLEPKEGLREASQVKNIWIPYGESLEGGTKY
jgi:aldehyde dehydrogenase (NAD+)